MSKRRSILVSLLAVFSFVALASTSASAAVFEIEGALVASPTEIEGKEAGNQVLTSTGLGFTMTCTTLTIAKGPGNIIDKEGKSKAVFTYSECSDPNCTIFQPIVVTVKDQLEGTGTTVKDKFTQESTKPLMRWIISGCAFEGTYDITGSQVCNLPGATIEQTTHEIECTPAGSGLKIQAFPVTFKGNILVKLVSGKKWKAK